jgi:hypothetical protein
LRELTHRGPGLALEAPTALAVKGQTFLAG